MSTLLNQTAVGRQFGWSKDHVELIITASGSSVILDYIPAYQDYRPSMGSSYRPDGSSDVLTVDPEKTLGELTYSAGLYELTYYIIRPTIQRTQVSGVAGSANGWLIEDTASAKLSYSMLLENLLGGDGYQHLVYARKLGNDPSFDRQVIGYTYVDDALTVFIKDGNLPVNQDIVLIERLIEPVIVPVNWTPVPVSPVVKSLRGPKLPQPEPPPVHTPVSTSFFNLSTLPTASDGSDGDTRWPTQLDLSQWIHFGSAVARFEAFLIAIQSWLRIDPSIRPDTPWLAGSVERYWFYEEYPRTNNIPDPLTASSVITWVGVLPSGSSSGSGWRSVLWNYDFLNRDQLYKQLPEFVRDDSRNQPLLTLMQMIGNFFDQFWTNSRGLLDYYQTNHQQIRQSNSNAGWASWELRSRHHSTYWKHNQYTATAYRSLGNALAIPEWNTKRVGMFSSSETIIDQTAVVPLWLSPFHRFNQVRLDPEAGEVRSGYSPSDTVENGLLHANSQPSTPDRKVNRSFRRINPVDWNSGAFINREIPWIDEFDFDSYPNAHREIVGYLIRPTKWDISEASLPSVDMRMRPNPHANVAGLSKPIAQNATYRVDVTGAKRGFQIPFVGAITKNRYLESVKTGYNRFRDDLWSMAGRYYWGFRRYASDINQPGTDGVGLVAGAYQNLIGVFSSINPVVYRPGVARISLRQLANEVGAIRELGGTNREVVTVQHLYRSGENASVSLWKPGVIPGVNGLKNVIESGYRYNPILAWDSSLLQIPFTGVNDFEKGTVAADYVSDYPVTLKQGIYDLFPHITVNDANRFTPGSGRSYPTYKSTDTGQYDFRITIPVSIYSDSSDTVIGYRLSLYRNLINDQNLMDRSEILYWPKLKGYDSTGNAILAEPEYKEQELDEPDNEEHTIAFSNYFANETTSLGAPGSVPYDRLATWSLLQRYRSSGDYYSVYKSSHGYTTLPILSVQVRPGQWRLLDRFQPLLRQTLTLSLPFDDKVTYSIKVLGQTITAPLKYEMNDAGEIRPFGTAPLRNTLVEGDKVIIVLEPTRSENITVNTRVTIKKGASLRIEQKNQNLAVNGNLIKTISGNIVKLTDGMSIYMNGNYTSELPEGSSLLNHYGSVEDPFIMQQGDILVLHNKSVSKWFTAGISVITINSDSTVSLTLDAAVPATWLVADIDEVAILRRKEDETCVYIKLNRTSTDSNYGFLIPNRINPRLLENIDPILTQIKAKLLLESQQI